MKMIAHSKRRLKLRTKQKHSESLKLIGHKSERKQILFWEKKIKLLWIVLNKKIKSCLPHHRRTHQKTQIKRKRKHCGISQKFLKSKKKKKMSWRKLKSEKKVKLKKKGSKNSLPKINIFSKIWLIYLFFLR